MVGTEARNNSGSLSLSAHKQPYELILQETLYNIQELNNKK